MHFFQQRTLGNKYQVFRRRVEMLLEKDRGYKLLTPSNISITNQWLIPTSHP